jgi:hypothetical protein
MSSFKTAADVSRSARQMLARLPPRGPPAIQKFEDDVIPHRSVPFQRRAKSPSKSPSLSPRRAPSPRSAKAKSPSRSPPRRAPSPRKHARAKSPPARPPGGPGSQSVRQGRIRATKPTQQEVFRRSNNGGILYSSCTSPLRNSRPPGCKHHFDRFDWEVDPPDMTDDDMEAYIKSLIPFRK